MFSFIMLLARRGSRIYELVGIDTSRQKTAEVSGRWCDMYRQTLHNSFIALAVLLKHKKTTGSSLKFKYALE